MKRRAQAVATDAFDKVAVAKELISIKLAKEELESREKALKGSLMDNLEIGGHVDADGYRVSRIKTVTPFVSTAAASAELDMDDFMQVVKVSVTELRKKMGEEKINEIAEKFDVKDYISVKELK